MYFFKAETILNQIKESEEASWLFVDKKREKNIKCLSNIQTYSIACLRFVYVCIPIATWEIILIEEIAILHIRSCGQHFSLRRKFSALHHFVSFKERRRLHLLHSPLDVCTVIKDARTKKFAEVTLVEKKAKGLRKKFNLTTIHNLGLSAFFRPTP